MATQKTFNGKLITIPGSYSEVKSGVNNPPLDFSYGNVLVIDKDANNPFGGGSGIAGELDSGENAIYEFDNLSDFRSFIKGGKMYDNALPLFRPSGSGIDGVSRILYTRALTTTAAKLTLLFAGASGGFMDIRSKHEGLAGNGVQGDGIRASQVLNVTTVGAAADTCAISINSTALGTYTQVAGATTETTAAGIAALINAGTNTGLAHGYTATVSSNQLTVYAPLNSGAAANAYGISITNTGTIVVASGAATMAGGTNGTKLTRGIAMTMSIGEDDTSKYIFRFWRGTFAGVDENNVPYNGDAEAATDPDLLVESPEVSTITELADWMGVSVAFNTHLKLVTNTLVGTGAFTAAHLAANVGNQLFSGGTQTYNTARVDDIMKNAIPLDYTFVYTLDSGSNVKSVDNTKILDSLRNEARYEKFLVVGGGDNSDEFDSISIDAAKYYDTDRVIVVHGGVEVAFQGSGNGFREKDSSYKAAHFLGRMCGLPPQTPVTFKTLGYAGEIHKLSEKEKERALKFGVLATAYDYELEAFTVVHAINSLQRNDYVLNSDGTSHLISLKRIAAQLNKEFEINAKRQLLGNQSEGPNRSTLSAPIVSEWAAAFLQRKTATTTEDNLIISFQDITATFNQDSLHIRYAFVPNFEVNKLFITGLIIDPS